MKQFGLAIVCLILLAFATASSAGKGDRCTCFNRDGAIDDPNTRIPCAILCGPSIWTPGQVEAYKHGDFVPVIDTAGQSWWIDNKGTFLK